ncbi:MAG TPA: endonuclease III [Gemmatimonadaceae bacterium]|nr:endonuclease III [Gemmatimonadaceae bacterium]
MAGRTSGPPRQPLSRRRPKVAALRKLPNAARPRSSKQKLPAKPAPAASARSPRVRKEDPAAKQLRAAEIYRRLSQLYPEAHCELDYGNPYELLVATILSAQTTDKRVNMVTPTLFAKYPDVEALARAKPADVEEIIKSTGFFRAKTKSIIGMAGAVVDMHNAKVPSTLSLLVTLPGVGRKTANVVLGNAFDVNEGVVVDTHVARLSKRLDFTREDDPVKIEQALMRLFPHEQWTMLSHLLIWHGRRICFARKPKCGDCVVAELCPSAFRV